MKGITMLVICLAFLRTGEAGGHSPMENVTFEAISVDFPEYTDGSSGGVVTIKDETCKKNMGKELRAKMKSVTEFNSDGDLVNNPAGYNVATPEGDPLYDEKWFADVNTLKGYTEGRSAGEHGGIRSRVTCAGCDPDGVDLLPIIFTEYTDWTFDYIMGDNGDYSGVEFSYKKGDIALSYTTLSEKCIAEYCENTNDTASVVFTFILTDENGDGPKKMKNGVVEMKNGIKVTPDPHKFYRTTGLEGFFEYFEDTTAEAGFAELNDAMELEITMPVMITMISDRRQRSVPKKEGQSQMHMDITFPRCTTSAAGMSASAAAGLLVVFFRMLY